MSAGSRGTLVSSLLIGLVIALAFPLVELWLACRSGVVPRPEACVWGHALLPVSLSVGTALGLLLGLLIFGVRRALARPR